MGQMGSVRRAVEASLFFFFYSFTSRVPTLAEQHKLAKKKGIIKDCGQKDL